VSVGRTFRLLCVSLMHTKLHMGDEAGSQNNQQAGRHPA
jgi:hypothetical protein